MKYNKLLKSVICLSLSFVMMVSLAKPTFSVTDSEGNDLATTYISDIKVFSGKSTNEAVSACEKENYIPVKKNINKTSKGDSKDNGIYILGYKTTDKKEEGITGISMLQMNAGYQDYTYADVAEASINKLGNIPEELEYAVEEFETNYKANSPAAIAALDVLNCYYIDELDHTKLGDYLVSGDCTVDFLKKIIARSNTAVVSTLYNTLAAGVAENSNENWASRVSQNTELIASVENGKNTTSLHKMYKVLAKELVDSLQEFSKYYHEANTRLQKNNQVTTPDVESNDENTMDEETADTMTNGEKVESSDGDAYYLYAYEVLNRYKYNDSTKLGDYIVSLGDASYETTDSLTKIYPLVDALTNGQVAIMRLAGVATTSIFLVNESGLVNEVKEKLQSTKDSLIQHTGTDSISIWTGTDQTIYNQKVAITTEAYRANSAGQIYNTLTEPDKVDEFLSDAMDVIQIVSEVAGVAYGITYISTTVVSYLVSSLAGASAWAICCAGIGSGVFGTIFGILGCAALALSTIALIAMLVVLAVMFIKWVYDFFAPEKDDESFTEIPAVLYDSVNKLYVKYEVITDMNNNAANINGKNARRWNALYYTKSSSVGDPICSSDINDLIQIQYDDNSTPTGYSGVKCFGETSTANLNANSKSDSCSIYMYTKQSTTEINTGDESKTSKTDKKETEYISKLCLKVESSETAAKAALTDGGYKVIDTNLTPAAAKNAKKYTYLGYQTSTNEDDGITDIRIAPQYSSKEYIYGTVSYACCGTTPTGDSIYYTSVSKAGTPIVASDEGLLIRHSLDEEVPSGYEPVNMFCGGNAYNLNSGGDLSHVLDSEHNSISYSHWKDKGTYLYFNPSTTYTSGQEYIGGIVLVAGNTCEKSGIDTANDYIKALKLNKFDLNLTQGACVQYGTEHTSSSGVNIKSGAINTYVCYSLTYNPYRAIYGIRSYTNAPNNNSMFVTMGNTSTGVYSVSNVLFELPYSLDSDDRISNYLRGVYGSHSYMLAVNSGSSSGLRNDEHLASLAPEDYESVSWKSCTDRGKALYVLGPGTDASPLTVDDIKVSTEDTTPEGYVSVEDFKTPNRTTPHNLGYKTNDKDFIAYGKKLSSAYIYVKSKQPVEKTYISSISVSSYTINSVVKSTSGLSAEQKDQVNVVSNDYCVANLLYQCSDEIIQANVANCSKSFYNSPNTIQGVVSYIGVSRTNNSSNAITGIIRYVTKDKEAPSVIKVGDITYMNAGDQINDSKGSYYLYYTTSPAATPGEPLTSITVSNDVYEANAATTLSANTVDVKEIKSGRVVEREGVEATLYGDTKVSSFVHMYYDINELLMSDLYVGHGKTKNEALCDLMGLGATVCIDMDVNKGTSGEYVYIGYSKYRMDEDETKSGIATCAIRDIIATVGKPHKESVTVDDVEYQAAIDDYTYNDDYDGSQGVSLNTGTGGKSIYLYYTTDYESLDYEPIQYLGIACKDYAIINDETNKWEYILDDEGHHVNTNDGAVNIVNKHLTDNRIYLYASRHNGAVKENAEVDQNKVNRIFKSYKVYLKGA